MADFNLDSYIEESEIDPFVFNCGDNGKFVINYPNGTTLAELTETPINQTKKVAQLLMGEHFEAIWAIVSPLPGTVLADVTNDIIEHFNLGQMGKSRAERRAGKRSLKSTVPR
jgi:hypothetical protein